MKEQIIEQIQKLIEKTENNGVIWRFISANSYSWTSTKEGKSYILNVVKGNARRTHTGIPSVGNFTLTLNGAQRNDIVFQLSSTYSNEISQLLSTLFEKAKEQSVRNFVNILGDLTD